MQKLSGVTWNLQVLDDPKSLVLAKAGKEDFVNPVGNQITYELRQAGWTDLVDLGDLFKYGPTGKDSPAAQLVQIIGVAANGDFVNKNPNTVLRFMSVVWRIIDETAKDPTLFDLQAPYLNSFAGGDMTGKDVASTISSLDPFTSFDNDKAYYGNPDSLLYATTVWTNLINNLVTNGVLPKDAAKADDVMWGGAIWQEMVSYQTKAEALLAKAATSTLTADKKATLDKAKGFCTTFDFLDCYRLALAATT